MPLFGPAAEAVEGAQGRVLAVGDGPREVGLAELLVGPADEPLPIIAAEESWRLPPTNDLRDLLAQLEKSAVQPPRQR